MDTYESPTTDTFSFKNRQKWSKNRFAWSYAILILLGTVLFGLLLSWVGIYETLPLRIVNLFIILVGFMALMRDYRINKKKKLAYGSAFALCARTGIYFCLLFLPVLLILLNIGENGHNYVQLGQSYGFHLTEMETVFWSYIETVGSTLTAGLLASYVALFKN
ncbi:hypothetical protein K8352_10820 [Flavobacteriaceae bacterium F89]|uniref:DUF4199 domain-containing protein n=1 Tax=Cerina litoralis TaxID=2874477 RepID=A0AAE3EWZ2_9FLAO|nr:hypothetical protein [Cerina litoralis]MCG2461242.1 hypothetical protein [Cerina litoralis]